MKNSEAPNVKLATPYTLDSLLGYLRDLPDYPLQRYLKECLTELKKLTGKDVSPDSLLRISNDLAELDLPLVGSLPWEMFTEKIPSLRPYHEWVKCLADGKNSNDCILPEEFLNWRDQITTEPFTAQTVPTDSQAIEISKPGQIFRADVLKMLIRNQRNYRRHLGTWDQELEELYRQIQ